MRLLLAIRSQHNLRVRGEVAGVARSIARIARDKRGNVAVLFGFLLPIMVMAIGGAVDIGRWLQARSVTLSAIDAAVLAGGRSLQVLPNDQTAAISAAQAYYSENTRERLGVHNDTVDFHPSDNGTSFTAQGNAFINTPFLSVAGVRELPLLRNSGSDFAKSVLAVGGNASGSLEISMMLDITGSMGGQKIADLKSAASDLVDIVVWSDQSQYTSRVALVPFSETVNLGSYADAARGPVTNTGTTTTYSSTVYKKFQFTRQNGGSTTYTIGNCVTERTGADAYTDAAPSDSPVGRSYPSASGACNPSNTVIPLTSDKTALKSAINSYAAGGNTAGHLGTAWAWYMLSPNFASLWPDASRPGSYDLTHQTTAQGKIALRKIAILMTDGEYNTQYCDGVADRNTGFSTRINCASPNGSSTDQARTLCTEMKRNNISVYSIGFQLGGNAAAISTLKDYCASDAGSFYSAENGTQLRQAFRDIALKISSLYLSK